MKLLSFQGEYRMNNSGENSELGVRANTWEGYFLASKLRVPDYNLKIAFEVEVEANTSKKQMLKSLTPEIHKRTHVAYCNKTGQIIGLFFGQNKNNEVSTSIASQWLLTGDKALLNHSSTSPIAYTVYLLGKFLAPYANDIDQIESAVKIKIDVYQMLVSTDRYLLTMLQHTLRVIDDSALTNDAQRDDYYREFKSRKFDHMTELQNLIFWCAETLYNVYDFPASPVTTQAEFEAVESKIAIFEQNARNKYYAKAANPKPISREFLMGASASKPRNANMVKAAEREKEAKEISDLLGDIMGA